MPQTIIDPSLFGDVADALNIKEVAFVEKDYYAVQLLKLINELAIPNFKLIFSGGTCLSKAYKNTERMSEDIDMKFSELIPNRTKAQRKELCKLITDAIQRSEIFSLNKKQIHDQYCAQALEIKYPNNFQNPALKMALKLELVQSVLYSPINKKPIYSIYSEAMKEPAEIESIECVNIESIIAEKLIALLWRTSALTLGVDIDDDPTLVRHIYDIHISLFTKEPNLNFELMKDISRKSLVDHAKRYNNKHPDFTKNPKAALQHGLEKIQSDALHKNRYEQFLLPLLYAKNPPAWNDALDSLQKLYQDLHG